MAWFEKIAPIPSSFLLLSMLIFIMSVVYWNSGKLDPTWGFAFCLVAVIMFIASFISLSRADVEALIAMDEHLGKTKH